MSQYSWKVVRRNDTEGEPAWYAEEVTVHLNSTASQRLLGRLLAGDLNHMSEVAIREEFKDVAEKVVIERNYEHDPDPSPAELTEEHNPGRLP